MNYSTMINFVPLYGIALAVIAFSMWELWQDPEDLPDLID